MFKFARFIVLVMCFVLLSAVLVGCGEGTIDEAQKALNKYTPTPQEPYVTLNMYIPVKVAIDDDTVLAMQNEFNQITEELYRTRVVFKLIEESKYEAALKEQRDFALQNKDTEFKQEQTSIQDKYPKEVNFQFDIFVATGEALVKDYVAAGAIFTQARESAPTLTEMLNTNYYTKFCDNSNRTMAPIIYQSAVDNGVRHGIPANFLIGNYTYYVVDRDVADELFFEHSSDKTAAEKIARLESNITAANKVIQEKGEDRPLYNAEEIIKKEVVDLTPYPADEYYHLVMTNPQLTTGDIYNGMFCIASTCHYPEKALQVISALYNNAELHNTLQYGAKEMTYTIQNVDGRDVVVPVENGPAYSINPRYTGNIANLYECNDATLSGGFALTREYLDRIYAQNLDAEF